MGLIDNFQSDLSKFFNDSARRGDSIQTQLENSDKSINDFTSFLCNIVHALIVYDPFIQLSYRYEFLCNTQK